MTERPQEQVKQRDEKGRYLPGVCPNPGGKPKGIKERASAIKLAFFEVFDRIGGVDDLEKWVKRCAKNKAEFYKHLLGILPKELQIEGEGFGDTKIIIVRDGNKTEAVAGQVRIQPEALPGPILGMGDGQDYGLDLAGNAIQRADTK